MLYLQQVVSVYISWKFTNAGSYLLSSVDPLLASVSLALSGARRNQLALLESEYCPTSLPVCIVRGSISGQLAPVLI